MKTCLNLKKKDESFKKLLLKNFLLKFLHMIKIKASSQSDDCLSVWFSQIKIQPSIRIMCKKALFFILSVSILIACKNSSNVETDENKEDTVSLSVDSNIFSNESTEIISNEKIHISEKCIIFFMPTESEIADLIDHYGEYSQYDFIQLFSNFKTLAISTRKTVKVKGIFSDLTTSENIEIETTTGLFVFNRKSTDDLVGQIFYNGLDKPEVKFGVLKNKDLTAFIKSYFSVKDYENTELDSIESNAVEELSD
jgi:hypothetical protein